MNLVKTTTSETFRFSSEDLNGLGSIIYKREVPVENNQVTIDELNILYILNGLPEKKERINVIRLNGKKKGGNSFEETYMFCGREGRYSFSPVDGHLDTSIYESLRKQGNLPNSVKSLLIPSVDKK